MESENKTVKSTEVYIKRNRIITAAIGLVYFAMAGVLYALFYVYVCPKLGDDGVMLLVAIAIFVWSLVMFALGALCMRNLFFANIVTADERGLNVYSGLLHIGHVDWSEVEKIALGSGNKWYDMIDGELFSPITLQIKDDKSFKSKRDLGKRYAYFWNGDGVKLRTYCTAAKKRKMTEQLTELFDYYVALEETEAA